MTTPDAFLPLAALEAFHASTQRAARTHRRAGIAALVGVVLALVVAGALLHCALTRIDTPLPVAIGAIDLFVAAAALLVVLADAQFDLGRHETLRARSISALLPTHSA